MKAIDGEESFVLDFQHPSGMAIRLLPSPSKMAYFLFAYVIF